MKVLKPLLRPCQACIKKNQIRKKKKKESNSSFPAARTRIFGCFASLSYDEDLTVLGILYC